MGLFGSSKKKLSQKPAARAKRALKRLAKAQKKQAALKTIKDVAEKLAKMS